MIFIRAFVLLPMTLIIRAEDISWLAQRRRTVLLFVLLFVFFYCGSPAGDGTLAADLARNQRWILSQDITELPVVVRGVDDTLYPVHSNFLDESFLLTKIWTDPDSAYVYGQDPEGGWWRFGLDYSPRMRKYCAVEPFFLHEAPELSGLERLK